MARQYCLGTQSGDRLRRLNARANGNRLIGVDAVVWRLVKKFLNFFDNRRDARRAAHQDDLVDVLDGHFRIGQCLAAGVHGALDQMFDKRFKCGAR